MVRQLNETDAKNRVLEATGFWSPLIMGFCKESTALAVGVFDVDGCLVDANSAMRKLLGGATPVRAAADCLANPDFSTLIQGTEADEPVFDGLLTLTSQPDKTQTILAKVYRRSDQLLIVGEFDAGEFSRLNQLMIELNHDLGTTQRELVKEKRNLEVTLKELRQTETELVAVNQLADAANKAKSEFLAFMSHELRSPLNAINGFTEMLRMEIYGPLGDTRYVDYANDIHGAGIHLLQVINDILDLSKIESGHMILTEEKLEIKEEVKLAVKLVSDRAFANDVTLTIEVPNKLPLLKADRLRVKQMLLNLLTNAIKFTPKEGKVSVVASQNEERAILLKVTDTGIGISEENLSNVLNPFAQANDAMVREQEGTGLGLPLVKTLIELHDGIFAIESELNVGTTVSLSFPPERTIEA